MDHFQNTANNQMHMNICVFWECRDSITSLRLNHIGLCLWQRLIPTINNLRDHARSVLKGLYFSTKINFSMETMNGIFTSGTLLLHSIREIWSDQHFLRMPIALYLWKYNIFVFKYNVWRVLVSPITTTKYPNYNI